jgi:putative transposase
MDQLKNLHSDAPWVPLSGRHHGLVQSQSVGVEALKEAIARYGAPEIFNTDQGSQFTSGAWIDALTDAKIRISMDGKGAWRDNRMIERLWRSLKYECVYLNAFETGSEMRAGIGKWLAYYNEERPHSTHGILAQPPRACTNGSYEERKENTLCRGRSLRVVRTGKMWDFPAVRCIRTSVRSSSSACYRYLQFG